MSTRKRKKSADKGESQDFSFQIQSVVKQLEKTARRKSHPLCKKSERSFNCSGYCNETDLINDDVQAESVSTPRKRIKIAKIPKKLLVLKSTPLKRKSTKTSKVKTAKPRAKSISRPVSCCVEQLVFVLEEFLSKHCWDSAARALYALTFEPNQTSEVIWKCGYQILCNHPSTSPELMTQFAMAVSKLDKVFLPGIVLDCVIYYLNRGEFHNAKQAFQLNQQKQQKALLNEKQAHIVRLLLGYEGLLNYVDWNIRINEIAANVSQENNCPEDVYSESLANKAISIFEELLKTTGSWDIFAYKYLELMEFYNKKEKAKTVLHEYCRLNPLNGKAYVILYDFMKKHFPVKEDLLCLLKSLALLNPSEIKLLNVDKLIDFTERRLALRIIFNLVDYPSRKNNDGLWCYFAKLIINMCKMPLQQDFDYLKDLWEDRFLWWHSYHFPVSDINISDGPSARLFLHKAIVLTVLSMSGNSSFVEAVEKKLEAFEDLAFVKTLKEFQNYYQKFISYISDDETENEGTVVTKN